MNNGIRKGHDGRDINFAEKNAMDLFLPSFSCAPKQMLLPNMEGLFMMCRKGGHRTTMTGLRF